VDSIKVTVNTVINVVVDGYVYRICFDFNALESMYCDCNVNIALEIQVQRNWDKSGDLEKIIVNGTYQSLVSEESFYFRNEISMPDVEIAGICVERIFPEPAKEYENYYENYKEAREEL